MNYTILFLLTGVIYIYTGIHTLTKDRLRSQNRIYFTITILFAFWAYVNATLFLITDPDIAAQARRYMVFSWGVIYSVILHLVLEISGYIKKWDKKILFPLLYIPALINILLYFFDPYHSSELNRTTIGWVIDSYYRDNFIWNNYFTLYYFTFIVLALYVLVKWSRTTREKREKRQAMIVLHTMLIAFVGGTIFEVIFPIMGMRVVYGITVILTLIPVMGIWYAIEKYSLMNFNIKNLSYEIIDIMEEGYIICDTKGNILSINDGGDKLINGSSPVKVQNLFDINYKRTLELSGKETVDFINGDGKPIKALLHTQPISDRIGEAIGHLLLIQDITELADVQDKLQALNEELEIKVKERTMALSISNDSLQNEIVTRKKAEEKNRKMAFTDSLTDLPNGRHLKHHIHQLINDTYNDFLLLFFDLDDFKTINDTKGHSFGDDLLVSISNRLKNQMGEDYFIARKGGDEFYMVLKYKEESVDMEAIANRVKDLLNAPFSINDQIVVIESSIGICTYPKHGNSYQELMQYVDIAMYKAKEKGKNTYEIFTDAMYEQLMSDQKLIGELDRAIENDEFTLYYQPQIETRSDKVLGVEALIRWQHPDLGLLSPYAFITLAEGANKINEIGRWVIERAFSDIHQWQEFHEEYFSVSINLSVIQLHDQTLTAFIKQCSEQYKVALDQIHFEITESIFLSNDDIQLNTVKELLALGSKIVIDDFGMEYSSLNYLKKLPLSTLKIDRSFINGIDNSKIDETIIKTFVTLSNDLNINVIAEGIEEENQASFLNNLGCTIHQGYYYSKPLPKEELFKMVEAIHSEDIYYGLLN